MTYKEKQTVNIHKKEGLVKGVLLELCNLSEDERIWWVQVDNDCLLFNEKDLNSWNFEKICSCRSDSLGYYSHMYYCDKFN